MGGGLRVGARSTRLLAAGLLAAVVLALLGMSAAAARGGGVALPAKPVPSLVRVAAPEPVPHGIATPVEPPPPPAKKRVRVTSEVTVATPPPETTTTTAQPPPPPPRPAIPQGKGMWVWKPEMSDAGDVAYMVARARGVGLTHFYVRVGSSWDGFQNGAFLNRILPAAHAAGIKVYGWDFPKLADVPGDVARAVSALNFSTPDGHHIDGFAADIETPSEGTQLTEVGVDTYGKLLRAAVGRSRLLIAVVPNPTLQMRARYPYGIVVNSFDAVAPMVYWLNRDPGYDVAYATEYLVQFGKPMLPIGQAYDGGPEGGRPGPPSRAEILRFMEISQQRGAASVSFWSWQHATTPVWETIRDGPTFLPPR